MLREGVSSGQCLKTQSVVLSVLVTISAVGLDKFSAFHEGFEYFLQRTFYTSILGI